MTMRVVLLPSAEGFRRMRTPFPCRYSLRKSARERLLRRLRVSNPTSRASKSRSSSLLAADDIVPSRRPHLGPRAALDDIGPLLRVEARTSDENTIQLRPRQELRHVVGVDTATIQNRNPAGNAGAAQLHPNQLVNLRSIIGGGVLPSADGPHRLVRQHDLRPVSGPEGLEHRRELAHHRLLGPPTVSPRPRRPRPASPPRSPGESFCH